MGARLVERRGDEVVSALDLGRDDIVIGRDPAADYALDNPRISRRHAMIQDTDEGYEVSDLGSANGTLLNGEPLVEPLLLEDGDVIDLGNGATLEYEERVGFSPGWMVSIATLALVVVVVGAALLLGGGGGEKEDIFLDEAAQLAGEGAELFRGGDRTAARNKLSSAVSMLFSRGYLEGVPQAEVRATALGLLQERLDPPFDLEVVYNAPVEEAVASEPDAAADVPSKHGRGCRLDDVAARDLDLCINEHAIAILKALWQDPQKITPEFYAAVNREVRMLSGRRRTWLLASLERGKPFWPMMEEELVNANMPKELRYLSMIESGYDTKIKSHAGAVGLWQFIPSTARAYGLKVKGSVDERTDPRKSTQAAARYLRDLAFEFGGDALLLAIASYNKGENGMRRALKKLDDPRLDRSYWILVERDLLPEETQEYVPRLVAAAVIGEAGVPPVKILE